MNIYELKKEDEKAWDEYVFNHSNSTFYHQLGWKNVVEKSYRHKPYYLIAKENNKIKGVLPLFLMESKIFGKKLVSVPYAPYSGALADNEYIESALVEKAEKIMKMCDADYLELRNLIEKQNLTYSTNYSYINFVIKMDLSLDIIWENLRRDKKKGIKKAKKAKLEAEWNTNIVNFYNIYVRTMKELGTPGHNYNFFKNILNEFPNGVKILEIKSGDKVICCKFILFYKDMVISMWGVTLKEFQGFHPYDLANWEAIEYCCKKGYKNFDLGRCLLNSGVFQYKEGWSDKQNQLYYQFYLKDGIDFPDVGQSNPNRQRFAKIWKKLPTLITQEFGHILRKNFP